MKRILLLSAAIVTLFVGALAFRTDYFEISKNLEIFTDLYKELNTYYVDDIDPNDIMQEGIGAMLQSLDPYTNFISEADMEDYRFQTTGKYGGIGSLIQKSGEYVMVSEPYQDNPADEAGLRAGDRIVRIDAYDVVGKSTQDVSKLLKGEPGTTVEVEVERPTLDGGFETVVVDIVREEVQIDNVPYHGMVDEHIGYIRLSNFTQEAGQEVADALKDLKEEDPDLAGVVLDVRGNPGGLLKEAVNVCNVFIEKGELIVMTMGKNPEWDREFKTINQPVDTDIAVAVLTSRGSASASEIVSGAIQDLDRGVVIGQKTFGKGLVQTTRPLAYNSSLKVTTAKYYIPSGRCIQAIDYAERNEEGAVVKIPDSLKTAFETRNGRTVYDGGGIDPDIPVDMRTLNEISISLLRKNLIFDYATQFVLRNETIPPAGAFELSDAQYADFVDWLSDKEYDYTTDSERMLEELRDEIEEEGRLAAVEADLDELGDEIMHDKERDLQNHRTEIQRLLEVEIATRYHYQRGSIEAGFKYDDDLAEALRTLTDSGAYEDILTAR